MKKELIELYQNNDITLSYRAIKRFLGVSKKHLDSSLKNLLYELELEGILYEDKDSLFKSVPSNFFIAEINSTKKNNRFVQIGNTKYFIKNNKLNGALIFDKVLVSIDNDEAKVEKVIKRNLPYVVCEVIVDGKNKYLKPINIDNNLDVIVSSKKIKKLIDGERVLVKVSNKSFDVNYSKEKSEAIYKYEADIIKSIGHRNDPDIDYKTVAYNHGFNIEFSDEAIKESEELPSEVLKEDLKDRIDLRNWTTFTIDGIDCKDMDDAISIKKTKYGYILGVHIAHVSHYVKMGSALFEEALSRTTSVYFPESVIPMLPHKLSNGICSLNEDVDRLTRSFIIKFDENANIIDYKIVKAVIHSDKKMNYDDVEKILKNECVPIDYEKYVNDLLTMKKLSDKLSLIKKSRGYISFDSNELKFDLDNLGNTECINVKERKTSEELIENFMLIANQLVTEYVGERPCVYRNHPPASNFRLKDTLRLFNDLGYKLESLDNMPSHQLVQKLLYIFKDKEEFLVLSNLILRSLKLAYYSPVNEGHFGLALDNYSHFTSPIRRLADLLLHTLLDIYDERNLTNEETEKMIEFLTEACDNASKMERMSEKAEYEIDKVQIVNYVKKHIGEKVEVFIESIYPDYIVVRNKGLMDGVIYIDDFNNDKVYMLPSGKLKSRITGNVYKIGHKLEAEIKDASYTEKTIYYKLIKNLTLEEVQEKKLQKVIKTHM